MNIITSPENIVDAKDFSAYASLIHRLGFNVLPMKNKAPDVSAWKQYMRRYQTEQEVLSFPWSSHDIGIVNGINHLRTIDLDRCSDMESVFKLLELLGLDYGYQWTVLSPGKGGGFHVHFKCLDPLTLTSKGVLVGDPLPEHDGAFSQIELRWANCCTMFPPSTHPEVEERYSWAFGTPEIPIATIPLAIVEKAFLTLATPQKKPVEPAHTFVIPKPPKYDAWTQRALEQELSFVRSAPEGQRNNQLNRSAFNLGQIVGAGLLTEQDVEDELSRVGQLVGLEEPEIVATIKSGLAAGIQKPRMPKQVFQDNEPKYTLPRAKTNDEKLASFSADDQGNAEAVHHLYGRFLAYNSAYDWMVWNGRYYEPAIHRVTGLIVDVLRLRQKAAAHMERVDIAKISRCDAGRISACRSLLEKICTVNVDLFDCEPDLINTLSGIVNLRTKQLIPHDPKYRFTWCSTVRYNPSPDTSLWLDFVRATVAAPDMIGYLQEALGYSITGHTSEEALFYIYGPPRAGKGTLTETILSIFPRPIAIEVDFNTFTQKREGDNQNFDLAPMKAARLVFASESNKYQSLNPAKVKALTGGSEVHCAFKYGAFFDYKPQYAVWLSSNHECNGDPDDNALWGRVKVIHFPHSQLGKEDKSLKRRMQSPDNLEAVLYWLVEGAYQWYQHEGQGLQTPETVQDITDEQRAKQDTVGLWIEECCELRPDAWTENSKIMASYKTWCEENGYEAKKMKGLSQSLSIHGIEVAVIKRVTTDNFDSKIARGVKGLALL